MERGLPARILLTLVFGVVLSFLIVGTGSALKLSINNHVTKDALIVDKSSYQLLALTNAERFANGLKPLKLNDMLEQSAQAKCSDMIVRNYWGHITPDGKNVSTFVAAAGIKDFHKLGENLAIGQHSTAEVNQAWMNSPEHRANILDKQFTDVGFAQCTYDSNLPGLDPLNIYVEHFLAR